MLKVFIIQSNSEYRKMFEEAGWEVITNLVNDVPDLVCFTGGEDVHPSYYGEKDHPFTYANTERDHREHHQFNSFVEAQIPMVGICRGGQFLNVMNGGKMYQHVTNHTGSHLITDVHTKEALLATSTHHQMMRPGIAGKVIATAEMNGSKQHMNGDKIVTQTSPEPDYEVVFYPHTQSLCFQPHPEFGSDKLKTYFFSLLNRYLGV